MSNKINNVLFLIFFNLFSHAQQVPHYTQYVYNMQVINPAFVGANADISISLLSRKQWVKVEGAPETNTFSINGRAKNGLGFGSTLIIDQLGLFKSTTINIDASYTIVTSQYGRLSLGLKGGMTIFNSINGTQITPDNEVYSSNKGKFPNIGFGSLYYNNIFFVGLSIPSLLQGSSFRTIEPSNTIKFKDFNYFIVLGSHFQLSENILLKPTTLIKFTPTLPLSVDLNSNFIYKNKIETGLSYRYKNSVSAFFALILKEKYRVGYSYEYQLANYGGNLSSHEIILHIDFNLKRKTKWLFHNKCYFYFSFLNLPNST
jgi:type IX secretion system PorP/SprF family membrane protein